MFINKSPSRHPPIKELRNCRYIPQHEPGVDVDNQVAVSPRHRASYTLERGVWSATCRLCGFTARDAKRGRAATWFLAHIRATRSQPGADGTDLAVGDAWGEVDIDLDVRTSGPVLKQVLKTAIPAGEDDKDLLRRRHMAADGGR